MKADLSRSMVDQFRDLAVGDSLVFPAFKSASARSVASAYGFQWDREFVSKTNREQRTVTFTRRK